MKNMKKALALVLTIAMVLSMNITSVFAASSDATLKQADTKVKGVAVTSLGTPAATIASVTAPGAVSLTHAQATGNVATVFAKNEEHATVKAVKYAKNAVTTNFATDAAFADATAIANEDFFIVEVTAEDSTKKYYKIVANVAAALSNDASLKKVAGQGVALGSEAGTQTAPKTAAVNVPYAKAQVKVADIEVAENATVGLYTDAGFTAAADVNLTAGLGTDAYIKVTAQDAATIVYYKVTVNRAAASSDADLKVAGTKVKGVAVTDLGMPGTEIGDIGTPGAVSLTHAQATGNVATVFAKNEENATVKAVKYAKNAATTNFDTDAAFNDVNPIANEDFFIVRVTAEDGTTKKYYKIVVTVEAPKPKAALDDVTINGVTDAALAGANDIRVTLTDAGFSAMNANDVVTSWFDNLPAGLVAKIKDNVSSGDMQAKIEISGTPTATSNEVIKLTVPKEKLQGMGTADIKADVNNSAKFNIVAPLGKIELNKLEDAVMLAADNQNPPLANKTFVLKLTKGTLKAGFANADITTDIATAIPGLGITATADTAKNLVKLEVTGSATTAITADKDIKVTIKASAVTEPGAADSDEITLKIKKNVAETPLGKIEFAVQKNGVTMSADNKTPAADNTYVLKLAKGTPKVTVTNSEVEVTGLPAGLTYDVIGNAVEKTITIMVKGTATDELTADKADITVAVKAGAVKETAGVVDSDTANLTLKKYVKPSSGNGGGRTAESNAGSNAVTPAPTTPTVPAVTVKNEAAKELVKFITDQAQANQIDKLVENVPVTQKKEALKALTADTKTKLAAAVLPKFTDVQTGQWYSSDLAVVVAMGLVQGTGANTISPAKNVTGQEMMAMLVRSMGKEVTPISGEKWYDAYKGEATALKLDEGITFDLAKDLTRAEVAALMFKYVKLNEKEAVTADANALANVKDMADIPAEYKDAVAYMFQKGLLKGYEDGSFAPNKTVSRVEVASILERLLAM